MRVLIADEDPAFRGHVAQALDGHEVVEATSANEALESLEGDPFPLVITGAELLEQAKSANPEALVVVAMEPARAAEVPELLRSGAHDCLLKPSEDDLVAAVLRRAVHQIGLAQENQALLASLKRNVEALGEQNQKLEYLATRDGLTELYNHRYFREAFDVEISRCKRHDRVVSLVFADIDHFKTFNDTCGHLAGDRLLSALGRLITTESRKSTIVARYGGEEFVLLVPETDHKGAMCYAEKIRALVESHAFDCCEEQPAGRITLSMGVATFPEHGTDADSLIKHADDALYRAKAAGRNQVCG